MDLDLLAMLYQADYYFHLVIQSAKFIRYQSYFYTLFQTQEIH